MVSAPEPRLNPFAFPSETDFRFILLVVAVVGASLFIYADLYNTVFLKIGDHFSAGTCVAWMVGGSLFTLATAMGLYWGLPAWKIKHSGLRLLGEKEIPGLHPYLLELSAEAGISRSPTFLWNALDQTREGFAFGRWGDLYVYLPRGLINDYDQKRAEFRAIVLHELAHIRNGDVHKTYLSYTVWWAFLITALPVFVVTLWQSPPARMVGMGLRVLILFLLIYLTRNAVLRVREFYADLKASLWDRDSSALRLAIESAQAKAVSKRSWQRIWLTHPKLSDRTEVLQNPAPLFAIGFWEAFATGMAVMIPFTNLVATVGLALVGGSQVSGLYLAIWMLVIPGLVSAGLMIYILGVGIWRSTFAAAARQQPVRGICRLGLGLALGIVIGLQVSFIGASNLLGNPVNLVLWFSLLVAVLIPFLNWISLGAQLWFGPAIATASPRPFYRWGLLIATGLLTCIFASLFAALLAFNAGTSPFSLAVHNPLMVLGLTGLWAFPLMACFWQPDPAKTKSSSWLFLDQVSSPHVSSTIHRRQLIAPLVIGLIGGVLGWGVLFLLRGTGLDSVGNLFAVSMVMQGLTGAIAAALPKRLGSLLGLFSGAIAGLVMVIGYGLMASHLNLSMGLFLATGMLNSGGLCAIPVVLVVTTVSSGLRRLMS